MKIEKRDAESFSVEGINLHKYITGDNEKPVDVLHVSVEEDHRREFSNSVSHFIYYVVGGHGRFWIDGNEIDVRPNDVIHAEPECRIYYRGSMEMILVTTPPYDESNDVFHGVGRDKY